MKTKLYLITLLVCTVVYQSTTWSQTICTGETALQAESFGNTPFTTAFPDGITTYKLMKEAMPEIGEYAVSPLSGLRPEWHNLTDHTGDPNGNMLLLNPGEDEGDLYTGVAENLTPLTYYAVSLYALNINIPGSCASGRAPQVKIVFEYLSDAAAYYQLSSFTSNLIPDDLNPQWEKITAGFYLPAGISKIRYRIINNSLALCGNAIAIDDIRLSQCASLNTLPVKELKINNIESADGKIKIRFSTAAESQTASMETEKSTDGIFWKTIHSQPAAGNSDRLTNYTAWDNEPAIQHAWYRIRQTDTKGAVSYSAILKYTNSNTTSFTTYPTPFTSQLTISFTSAQQEPFTVILYTGSGIALKSQVIQARKGLNAVEFNTGHLKQGSYIISIANAGNTVRMTKNTIKQ